MEDSKYFARQIVRFWKKIDKRDPDECWPWLAGKDKDGYGKFIFNRGDFRAHRVSFIIANGSLSDDLLVLHSCDNPTCCNPAHLSSGTHADNLRGREIRGRNGNAKLNAESVRLMRQMFLAGEKYTALANRFGVDYKVAYNTIKKIAWKHVD